MSEQRPNPELLLKEIQSDEARKKRGKLKIFFGYAAGVGKTYAMLEEAHSLKKAGVDVVIGYVEPHQRPQTSALMEGLPSIPPHEIKYGDTTLYEFDIDSAQIRKPELILVDELAHTNLKGCRHKKRYQDIEELLHMGINVYTTVNVQHIEGLNDIVSSITGVAVRERVPDTVFDSADKVELVDIEPEDLIVRLNSGNIYRETQARLALDNFFTKENLIALREIALRRTADRVNITVEKNKQLGGKTEYFTGEHILMCLSCSPSNAKVVRTSAKMAEAFHGTLTALFVETSDFEEMTDENKVRLRENLRLAEQLGGKIVTVYGDDVSKQVSEYAKASGVSKIVLGRPAKQKIFGIFRQSFVDKLSAAAPNLEIYVIPDTENKKIKAKTTRPKSSKFSLKDTLKSFLCLAVATAVGFLFHGFGFSESNIITMYILASLFTAVVTDGKIYSLISSVLAVLMFNFFFTDPVFSFTTYNVGYPVTFVVMFLSAFITSSFTKRVKEQAKQYSLQAHRTEVLLETSQKLQQAKGKKGILCESVNQIEKLLGRTIILYPAHLGELSEPMVSKTQDDNMKNYLTHEELAVAQWVLSNNKHAGATTNTLSGAKCLYMSIRSGDSVFAVVGVALMQGEKIDSYEKSLLISMLGECALALEKESIREAKDEIMMYAVTENTKK